MPLIKVNYGIMYKCPKVLLSFVSILKAMSSNADGRPEQIFAKLANFEVGLKIFLRNNFGNNFTIVNATIPLTRRTLVPKGLQRRRGQFIHKFW